MIFKIPSVVGQAPNYVVSLRCPSCRQRGTFEAFPPIHDAVTGTVRLGQRRCPNPECQAHVFFAAENEQLVLSYPAERIDFDSSGIPASIVSALEEAITSHATKCFTAAAIMVRKTLEELCREVSAKGDNLKVRIGDLATKVTLPKELLEGLDDLRLLGNDAAHVESRAYDEVGQEEVEVGILFAKEVLKAAYQYKSLLERLKSLKRKPEAGSS